MIEKSLASLLILLVMSTVVVAQSPTRKQRLDAVTTFMYQIDGLHHPGAAKQHGDTELPCA